MKIQLTIILVILSSVSARARAISFKEAVAVLAKHDSVETALLNAQAKNEEAKVKGSFGDPMLKIAAKNYPEDSLKNDQTPMTGVEFGISQKFALTTKFGNMENSLNSLALAYKYEASDKKEALTKALWEILILKRKIKDELSILNENNLWITKILKISKKLYSTGKISQQAILDIQIRKSEIESELSNKQYEQSQLEDKILYLIGDSIIEEKSIPWNRLKFVSITNADKIEIKDYKEMSLKEKMKAKDLNLTAAKLNFVPDLTLSLGVTKRQNIDGHGDFVGAAISFPLPFSSEKYASHAKAKNEKLMLEKQYQNYEKLKLRNISVTKKEINKIKNEINILDDKTIKFSQNSRQITSKSYGLGNSSYVELLQSELKLQKILMHKVELAARRDMNIAKIKYILGESLYE